MDIALSALTSAIHNTGHYHVRLVAHFLRPFCKQWVPEQIAGWLKRQYPTDPDMQLTAADKAELARQLAYA